MNNLLDVFDFHAKFGLPRGDVPKPMAKDAYDFRHKFLLEETKEYTDGWLKKNLVGATDALLDTVYVALGTALFIGTPQSGALGTWPKFSEVRLATIAYGFAVPEKPVLLTGFVNRYFVETFSSSIGIFSSAHFAATMGDNDALLFALGSLKRLTRKCYMAAVLMGIPWEVCWNHVQAANMAKKRAAEDGSDSVRHTPWDVVKPTGWKAPDMYIAKSLQDAGWNAIIEYNAGTGKVTAFKEGDA